VSLDRNPAAALSLMRIGSFDLVGGGKVQVAQDAMAHAQQGLRASRGPLAAAMNRLSPTLMRASTRGIPLGVHGTSHKGMPWATSPVVRAGISAD
jgi:hypothetical protein